MVTMRKDITARRILIQGIVQGVGFRPFVYEQAIKNSLTGWVRNSSAGVEIEITGKEESLDALLHSFQNDLPPLARVDTMQVSIIPVEEYPDFQILASKSNPGEFIPISPDIAICPDCQRELFDNHNRRFRYPFINCTNCGPRFTIIQDIPYDRPFTTMKAFPLCPECKEEYANPLDRRFHAQPIACDDCGPQLSFQIQNKEIAVGEAALKFAREWIKNGKIIAVKGLGGFHLACDARNDQSVSTMRTRKRRNDKPFALMAFNLESIENVCVVSPVERELLTSRQKPVVLLQKIPGTNIAPSVAPQLDTLGIMLAYTPLHLLLLEPEAGFPDLLVMTSGNMSEEPIAYQDEESFSHLASIADAFLTNNRPIHMRVDDSVVREERNGIYPIRRARGYAPDAISLLEPVPQLLSTGALLKNTYCLTLEKYAFLSHHIGDLENYETFRSFREGIIHYQNLFHIIPEIVVCDLHPDYLSTRYAQNYAEEHSIPLLQVQHHHAHLASVIAENYLSIDEPVIGLCFDGTGFGTDNTIWGGEVLAGNVNGYQRISHLSYMPLPGGDAAIHHPARMVLAYLWHAGMEWDSQLPAVQHVCSDEKTMLFSQLQHGINTPHTSSMGRLFDVVSALIGVCTTVNYEGQAAILLEAIANPDEMSNYSLPLVSGRWDIPSLLKEIVQDYHKGASLPDISARFHNTLVQASRQVCDQLRNTQSLTQIALSGGVWQNRLLLRKTISALESDDFKVFTHHQVPTNDGGISLGQAWIAANNPIIGSKGNRS